MDGPAGPGRKLAELLGDEHEIVATVWCGDDHAPGAAPEILELIQTSGPTWW